MVYASSGLVTELLVSILISLSASLPDVEFHYAVVATWFTIVVTVSCPSSTSLCFKVESSVSLLSVVPPSFWAVSFLGLPRFFVTPCSKPLADKSLVGCDRFPSLLFFGSSSNIRVLGWFWDLQLCPSLVLALSPGW